MDRRWIVTALFALAIAGPATASAQQAPAQDAPPLGGRAPTPRDSLEARVRERMGQMLRRSLGLNDDQMRRLATTNRRFEGERRTLFEQEREVRKSLRDEIMSGDTTRGAQVNALMDRMLGLQRKRLDLMEAEQKELATFLTPMQRAKYFGLEEQIRRRMMEARDGRDQGPGQRMRPGPAGEPRGGATPGVRRPRPTRPAS